MQNCIYSIRPGRRKVNPAAGLFKLFPGLKTKKDAGIFQIPASFPVKAALPDGDLPVAAGLGRAGERAVLGVPDDFAAAHKAPAF